MSQEIEIGLGKKGRLAYSLDDVSIVPSRRTRDPQDVSTSWQVDAYEFDVPVINAWTISCRFGGTARPTS